MPLILRLALQCIVVSARRLVLLSVLLPFIRCDIVHEATHVVLGTIRGDACLLLALSLILTRSLFVVHVEGAAEGG